MKVVTRLHVLAGWGLHFCVTEITLNIQSLCNSLSYHFEKSEVLATVITLSIGTLCLLTILVRKFEIVHSTTS